MNAYGVSVDIPAFYISQSAIYPNDPYMYLQTVHYILPDQESSEDTIRVHTYDTKQKKPYKNDLSELYNGPEYKYCSLKLM